MLSYVTDCMKVQDCTIICTNGVGLNLLTLAMFVHSTVYDLVCTSCQGRVPFDGGSQGVLNMGSFLITYFVVYDYFLHFVHGRFAVK